MQSLELELAERGYSMDYLNIIYVGGGALIARDYAGRYRSHTAYDCDLCANAKGYEFLARQIVGKQGYPAAPQATPHRPPAVPGHQPRSLPVALDCLRPQSPRGFGGLYPGDGCKDATGCGRCAAKVHFSKWTDADWCTRPIGIKVALRLHLLPDGLQHLAMELAPVRNPGVQGETK